MGDWSTPRQDLECATMRGVPMVSSEDSAWDVPPSIFGTRAGGPTVQRLVLGNQLHRLRDSRGITAEQAAEAIRGSHSKISRMEHGRVGFKERDVGDLLTLYGVTDSEERAALLNLAREANTPGWWHAYSDILPAWLEPYVGLEAAARDPDVPDPARAGAAADGGLRPRADPAGFRGLEEEIARRSELRASRQEILRGPTRRSCGSSSTRVRCAVRWAAAKSSASSSSTSSRWRITPR